MIRILRSLLIFYQSYCASYIINTFLSGNGLGNIGGVCFDSNQNLIVSDQSRNVICSYSKSQVLTTIAGGGSSSCTVNGIVATQASLNGPNSLTSDTIGNIYIADTYNNLVRSVNTKGIINTIAGGGYASKSNIGDGGPATSANLNGPRGVFYEPSSNCMYIADAWHNAIRRVSMITGIISTIITTSVSPYGLWVSNNLVVYYVSNSQLWVANVKTLSPQSEQIASNLNYANSVWGDPTGSNLYIVETGASQVRWITNDGSTNQVIAGGANWSPNYGDGGPATSAWMNSPFAVTMDSIGNLYIADEYNNRVRSVKLNSAAQNPSASPTVTSTVAPSSIPSASPSNSPSLVPSNIPTTAPSPYPTPKPTPISTSAPSAIPSIPPSKSPTFAPSPYPTPKPTAQPTSIMPTFYPTPITTSQPTSKPTSLPTFQPTSSPSLSPSSIPTSTPSNAPTTIPTTSPTHFELNSTCFKWILGVTDMSCVDTCTAVSAKCSPLYFLNVTNAIQFNNTVAASVYVANGKPVGSVSSFCNQGVNTVTFANYPAVLTLLTTIIGVGTVPQNYCSYPTNVTNLNTICDLESAFPPAQRFCPCRSWKCKFSI